MGEHGGGLTSSPIRDHPSVSICRSRPSAPEFKPSAIASSTAKISESDMCVQEEGRRCGGEGGEGWCWVEVTSR